MRATCAGWLTTEETEGEAAVGRVDRRHIATYGALLAADCDDELNFGKAPGMACTARMGEGMQAKGLTFKGVLPQPKPLLLVDAASTQMYVAEGIIHTSDLVETEALPLSPPPATAPAAAAATAGVAGSAGGAGGAGVQQAAQAVVPMGTPTVG